MYRGYQKLIHEIDPSVNPVDVEEVMRLSHPTLDHLTRKEFEREVKQAKKVLAHPAYRAAI